MSKQKGCGGCFRAIVWAERYSNYDLYDIFHSKVLHANLNCLHAIRDRYTHGHNLAYNWILLTHTYVYTYVSALKWGFSPLLWFTSVPPLNADTFSWLHSGHRLTTDSITICGGVWRQPIVVFVSVVVPSVAVHQVVAFFIASFAGHIMSRGLNVCVWFYM